jgi:hypothetical protein
MWLAGSNSLLAEANCGPNALFAARGSETQRITIGGYLQTQYQWIDVNDEVDCNCDPEEYNNFLMSHIRLYMKAELGCGWSAVMNIDFAGKSDQYYSSDFCLSEDPQTTTPPECPQSVVVAPEASEDKGGHDLIRSCDCKDQCKVFVDKAYIQKVWCDSVWRFGYQKVQWGAEWTTPEPHLKTIERSVATNFFQNLGRRVNAGAHVYTDEMDLKTYTIPSWKWVGNKFGQRKVGIYVQGTMCDLHYGAAITNGYDGLCMNSTDTNNSLGYYMNLGYETTFCEFDLLFGVNAGFQTKGSNAARTVNHNVYGFNPFIYANWNRFSLLGEFFWGSVEDAKVTDVCGDADPWGFNLIPSYMVNDCLELVGRFSYVNSDEMGMTIHNTFGCAPDKGTINYQGTPHVGSKISSNTLFEKVYATYLGVNYYMLNGAVKASLGLEQVKFKNRGISDNSMTNGEDSVVFNRKNSAGQELGKGAKVNAVRAAIQLLF